MKKIIELTQDYIYLINTNIRVVLIRKRYI